MNFEQLKELIKYIKKVVTCPHCNEKYTNKNIEILGTMPLEGLFHLRCHGCDSQVLVNVIINPKKDKHKGKKIDIITRDHRKISQDDILDVRNFLNNFNGDFKKLFSNKL